MTDGSATGRDEIEVAHEALIRHWPRLRAWLDQDRAGLLLRESIREAAREWERHSHDESYLAHRGRRLSEAEALAHYPRFALNALEQSYLDAAFALREREAQEREAQRQRELTAQRERAELAEAAQHEAEQRVTEQAAAARRLRRRLMVAVGLGAIALLAAVSALWGFWQAAEQSQLAIAAASTAAAESARADDQAATAEAERGAAIVAASTAVAERLRADRQAVIDRARALAAEAPRQAAADQGERGLLLARQAFLFNQAAEGAAIAVTDEALRSTLGRAKPSRVWTAHDSSVGSVVFSPDGQMLASAGNDNTIRLWDLSAPAAPPIELAANAGPVFDVAFSPDGQTLASGDAGGTVRLWDLADPTASPSVLPGHDGAAATVAFNSDGKMLASGGEDGVVRVWDPNDPTAAPSTLIDRENGISAVAFSPAGGKLAVSGLANGTVLLWDLANPSAVPSPLPGTGRRVLALAFSDDGETLATGSEDGSVRSWDLTQPEPSPIDFPDHEDQVTSVAFSPDSTILASGSRDGTARLRETSNPSAAPVELIGGRGAILSLAFSPNGQRLVSSMDDGTIRLWTARAEILAQSVCRQVTRNLTLAEWIQYVGEDVPYERTCPDLPPATVVRPLVLVGESAYRQAIPLAVGTDDSDLNNEICWKGSLDGFAEVVRPACDRAIALEPANGLFYDSRGLDRALTGDYAGAAADFERFLAWAHDTGTADTSIRDRENWIALLRVERSPFDQQTLERLRSEIVESAADATPLAS